MRFCAAPPDAGIANNPCANVFGVRRGPAAWMPLNTQAMFDATAGPSVAASTPQYQFSGSSRVDNGSCGGGGTGSGSVYGGRNDNPKACTDCSVGYERARSPISA